MSRTVVLSEAEQDAVLLLLYRMASRYATDLLRRSRRDDVVQDLALEWLEHLRAGTLDVPAEGFDAFVFEAVLARATGSAKRPGVIAEEYRPAAQVSTPSAGARVATGNDCKATVDVHIPARSDYESTRRVRRPTRQELEMIGDECETSDDLREATADDRKAIDVDREAVANDRSVAADDREAVAHDRETVANDRETVANDRRGPDDDCETTDDDRVTTDNEWAASAGVRPMTDDDREAASIDREATDTRRTATRTNCLVIAVV